MVPLAGEVRLLRALRLRIYLVGVATPIVFILVATASAALLVEELSASSEEQSAAMQELTATSSQLTSLADNLKGLVDRYKL
jgi:conjugal transfer/entry exclusion protein